MYNVHYPFNFSWQGQNSYINNSNAGNQYKGQLVYNGPKSIATTSSTPSPRKISNEDLSDYHPDPQLPSYNGPYPVYELQRARQSLINSMKHDSSDILQRIKPRIGINSCYGIAQDFIPPPQPTGTGSSAPTGPSGIQSLVPTSSNSASKPSSSAGSSGNLVAVPLRKRTVLLPSSSAASAKTAASSSPNADFGAPAQPTGSIPVVMGRAVSAPSSSVEAGGWNPGSNSESKGATDKTRVSSHLTLNSGNSHAVSADRAGRKRKSDSADREVTPAKRTPPDSSAAEIANAQQIYKCDFCNYQGSTMSVVKFHLTQAKHFSASLYNVQGTKTVSVEKKLAVKNKIVKNEALAVVCPTCHDLFEDIFMCGVHFKYAHGGDSNNGYYSICPVTHLQNLMVHQQPKCQKCDKVFEKHNTLHRHWRQKKHHPLVRSVPETAFAIFSCLYCNKTFYNNFLECKSHVLNHKDQQGHKRAMCGLKVRHVLKPLRKEELLPLSESSVLDGLQDEMIMLKNMKAHFNSMSGTRNKAWAIEQRIEFLKQFRKANTDNYEEVPGM